MLGSGSFFSSDSMYFLISVSQGVIDCMKNYWCEIDSVKKWRKGSVGVA